MFSDIHKMSEDMCRSLYCLEKCIYTLGNTFRACIHFYIYTLMLSEHSCNGKHIWSRLLGLVGRHIFVYLCLKSFYHGWHCLWGSSLPYRQRLPSQSGSSVLPAGSLLLTATGLPLRWWRTWSYEVQFAIVEKLVIWLKNLLSLLFDFDPIFSIYMS